MANIYVLISWSLYSSGSIRHNILNKFKVFADTRQTHKWLRVLLPSTVVCIVYNATRILSVDSHVSGTGMTIRDANSDWKLDLFAIITKTNYTDLKCLVRFEVFTAVTMKNMVFWDVAPCGS
jgi:hypothetical protein